MDFRLPWWLRGKESACQCRRRRLDSWVGRIPWRRKWQPTPIFLPGKSHGQRSLAGYSPWGCEREGQDLLTKQQQYGFQMHYNLVVVRVDILAARTALGA